MSVVTQAPPATAGSTRFPYVGHLMHKADAPWTIVNLSLRPFAKDGFYSFNPSIHRDPIDGTWRCVLRNADYHAPGGVYVANARKGGRVSTRNAMVILDPTTWTPSSVTEMFERDENPRYPASSLGYEDMRLFRTIKDGLVGVATAMHRHPEAKQEIVLCKFDREWNVIEATPLRGGWSVGPQKNWLPFDGAESVRLLYSIDRGWAFGYVGDDIAPLFAIPAYGTASQATPRALPTIRHNGAVETKIPAHANNRTRRVVFDWANTGLRGGSQLQSLGDGRWLGIGHEMRWNGQFKLYWHKWFTCGDMGEPIEISDAFKLSHCGIEFAAGLALDAKRDELVVSYGTEDADAWLGIGSLAAVLGQLKPVTKTDVGAA